VQNPPKKLKRKLLGLSLKKINKKGYIFSLHFHVVAGLG